VTSGAWCPSAKKGGRQLAQDGVDVEVIDLRTLFPYDWDHLRESIRRTGRVLFVNRGHRGDQLRRAPGAPHGGRSSFTSSMRRPGLLAGAFVPGVGLADQLDQASVPQKSEIAKVMRELARHQP